MTQEQKRYFRFSIFERIEHFVLILSFTTLGVTGIPQKFASWPVSGAIIQLFGGIELIRTIHHVAAAIFIAEAIYHLVIVGYKLYIQGKEASMVPSIVDGKNAIDWFLYNIGRSKKYPKMPRYNFMEKAEYWAMLWGLLVMALTGLALWNPIATTRMLPGEFIPAAKAAHGGEAVLAVLAIILWHFYHVHIKQWNWSMIKGSLSRHEMEEEHGLELEQIESGKLPQPPAPAEKRKRLSIFVPAAAVVSLALLGVTYYFLTFEQTSLTTLPPAERNVVVFSTPSATPQGQQAQQPEPQAGQATETPAAPLPTAQANGPSWNTGVDLLFRQACVSCHGETGGFNAESYANVIQFIEPGNPSSSRVIQVQARGQHPGQFNQNQLNIVNRWILAGAGENPGQSGVTNPDTNPDTWAGGISEMLNTKCGACHGGAGGYSVDTYENAITKLKPGDPDGSDVVKVQKAGGHPGQFSDDELNRLIRWIQAGAPQQ